MRSIVILMGLALVLPVSLGWAEQKDEKALPCPPGTEHVLLKTPEELAKKHYFPQAEEYCRKKLPDGTFVKHGLYILWGPNGERLEEGQYKDGKKDGFWRRWIPSQVTEQTWKAGKRVDSKVLPQPKSYVIDFGAAVPHAYSIPAGLGSTYYEVLGKEGKYCKLRYEIEIEMGKRPWVTCLVPTSIGKVTFENTNVGLDFSAIKQYVRPAKD
jgi:hypothetical protein